MFVEEKAALRREYMLRRKELCSAERNGEIYKNFLISPFFGRESFFVYLSVGAEADTAALIRALLLSDKRVLVPRIVKNEMYAVPYSEDRELYRGIPQPKAGEDGEAEVALTPLLAFDEKGYRLGYGGGFYDRYFARRPSVLKVGLAFFGQAHPSLPHDKHDVRLDAVITERGIKYFT